MYYFCQPSILALLQDDDNTILLINEVLQSVGRILAHSPGARDQFRLGDGFPILQSYLVKLKGSLSPEASYGRTGLPKVELAQKIDAVFNLMGAATRGSSNSAHQFSLTLQPNALFAVIRAFGCFYEHGKMENLPNSPIDFKLKFSSLDSNEKVLQLSDLSISIRRVLLAFAPIWRAAVVDGIIGIGV